MKKLMSLVVLSSMLAASGAQASSPFMAPPGKEVRSMKFKIAAGTKKAPRKLLRSRGIVAPLKADAASQKIASTPVAQTREQIREEFHKAENKKTIKGWIYAGGYVGTLAGIMKLGFVLQSEAMVNVSAAVIGISMFFGLMYFFSGPPETNYPRGYFDSEPLPQPEVALTPQQVKAERQLQLRTARLAAKAAKKLAKAKSWARAKGERPSGDPDERDGEFYSGGYEEIQTPYGPVVVERPSVRAPYRYVQPERYRQQSATTTAAPASQASASTRQRPSNAEIAKDIGGSILDGVGTYAALSTVFNFGDAFDLATSDNK